MYSVVQDSCYWCHEWLYMDCLENPILSHTMDIVRATIILKKIHNGMFIFGGKVYIQLPLLDYTKPTLMDQLATEPKVCQSFCLSNTLVQSNILQTLDDTDKKFLVNP